MTFCRSNCWSALTARYAMLGPSVVSSVVISRKLRKIDPWNTIEKLAALILLQHLDPLPRKKDAPGVNIQTLFHTPPGETFWFQIKICSIINTASCLTAASDHSCCQPSVTVAGVVNCCKPSATVVTCCQQSRSVVLTAPVDGLWYDVKVEQ